tara:strand:- start:4121 stop:4330 length:210 start_codon:yes stop_codon:yes gene_type:complete
MSWKDDIKKRENPIFREFTDALINLERALSDIQEIDSKFDLVEEAEVAVENAILDMEKRFEQYKKELRR